jgi:hypothetical protein
MQVLRHFSLIATMRGLVNALVPRLCLGTPCDRGSASSSASHSLSASHRLLVSCLAMTLVLIPKAVAQEATTLKEASPQDATPKEATQVKWTSLIKEESLDGWEITNFGGEGEVAVKDKTIYMDTGDPLTGVTSKLKDFPKTDYEMQWKARRVTGSDFFVGITFPVGDEHCSLICGGWGGGLTGISSINGNNASENETTGFKDFKNESWYSFRVRVDSKQIIVWLDDKEYIKVDREGKSFSLRAEVLKSRPLGYCVFQSKCEVKDWEYRKLDQ